MLNVTEYYYWDALQFDIFDNSTLSPLPFNYNSSIGNGSGQNGSFGSSSSSASSAAASVAASGKATALPPNDFDTSLVEILNFTFGSTTSSLFTTNEPLFSVYLEDLSNDKAGLLAFLFLFSFATVFGNSLVILAVIRERYLHTATNYFVTSLAVADCLVGLVVMPFSALYDVLENTWFFGEDWCDIWRSLDVLFSTASILNLCVISLDRYWAITDPFSYPMKMTRKKAAALIAAVWICSGAISFPAILWWRAVRTMDMPQYECPFTEHLGYLVFSSTISFYLPLLVMVFTYCRIYRAAAIQTRSLKLGTKQVMMASGELKLTLRIHRGGTTREVHNQQQLNFHQQQQQLSSSTSATQQQQHNNQQQQQQHNTANSTPEEPEDEPLSALHNNGLGRHRHLGKNFSLSRKLAKFAKEKKAAKTLGIVMGVFIVCWLPFFVVNLLSGFCKQCLVHGEIIQAIVTWLGWINSSMNPVIYACWSRDFRRAFVRILCVCCPRKIRRKYQPTMRSKASQCHVVAMDATSTSSCSICESSHRRNNHQNIRNILKPTNNHHLHSAQHNQHSYYRHRRRPAVRQNNKRCTFATSTTTIPILNQSTSTVVTSLARQNMTFEDNTHLPCQSQSSNSSNTSSIRILE